MSKDCKKLKAEVITAKEAVWPEEDGKYVTVMYEIEEDDYTGQSWAVFQGSKKKCKNLALMLNEGFGHFDMIGKIAPKQS